MGLTSVLLLAACRGETQRPTEYPTAQVYEIEPNFVGTWIGEIERMPGTLTIGSLGPWQFFGSFRSDDQQTEYVLLLEHSRVDSAQGGEVPSNRAIYTWQDGRGSRGLGWLLINREDNALTGSFGVGERTEGSGEWAFVRLDDDF